MRFLPIKSTSGPYIALARPLNEQLIADTRTDPSILSSKKGLERASSVLHSADRGGGSPQRF